jgi:hypothetical protein
MTIKLKKDFLQDELDLPYKAVKDTITSISRWSVHHEMVFAYGGKFYICHYSVGATEVQDERPWEYEDEVDCVEVHEVEQLMKVWKPL